MQILKIISKNYSKILLVVIFVIAVVLRVWYLPQGAISFAYDQARDAFWVEEILGGHLKILGPPVSGVPGLYHGVLYYYVIAPLYLIGHGNPITVAYGLSVIGSLGVFVVYFLTKLLVKNKIPALIAALLFAFSFEATQYANFMVNASLGVWFLPIVYIVLYLWITKSKRTLILAPILTGLAFGLSIQSEFALGYHAIPILIWLLIFRKNINKKQILFFFIALLLAISSMLIAEVKFGFTGTSGIVYLLTGQDEITQSKNLINYFTTIFSQSGKTFAYSLLPVNVVVGGVLGFVMIISSVFMNFKKIVKEKLTWETFLILYIFAYTFALPFGGWNMKHLLVGVAPAVCSFMAIFTWKYFSKRKLIATTFIVVILIANTIMIFKENRNGQTIFPLQPDLTLEKEMKIVSYTYEKSNGRMFSISSLTSPLYVNTLWSYIYNSYGLSKYGYLPEWVGRDQIGQLGNNLKSASGTTSDHYFIIEPTYGIPELYVTYAKGDQEAMSKFVEKISLGELVVEKRTTIK